MSGAPPVVLLLVILAAFLAQTFAIQTHVHLLHATASSDAVGAGTAKPVLSAAQMPGSGAAADCFLCDELAIAGHYLLPDGVALAAAAPAPFLLFLLAPVAIAVRSRSHRWQSRAPPR